MNSLGTIVVITALVTLLALAVFSASPWIAIPAIVVLVTPYIILFTGLAWFGGKEAVRKLRTR